MTEDKLPESVEHAVRAMCEDYDRRAGEIRRQQLSPAVIGHYMMLNAAIDGALASVCEESMRETMRRDIGTGTGHRFSQLYYLAPATYKSRKRACKRAIANALYLL